VIVYDQVKKKQVELELAVTVCRRSSLFTVDHFSEAIQRHGKGSAFCDVQLHRHKCTALISDVVASCLKEEMHRI